MLAYFIVSNARAEITITARSNKLFRGAENRTRTSRSQSVYTTTILRPDLYTFGVPGIEPGSHEPES